MATSRRAPARRSEGASRPSGAAAPNRTVSQPSRPSRRAARRATAGPGSIRDVGWRSTGNGWATSNPAAPSQAGAYTVTLPSGSRAARAWTKDWIPPARGGKSLVTIRTFGIALPRVAGTSGAQAQPTRGPATVTGASLVLPSPCGRPGQRPEVTSRPDGGDQVRRVPGIRHGDLFHVHPGLGRIDEHPVPHEHAHVAVAGEFQDVAGLERGQRHRGQSRLGLARARDGDTGRGPGRPHKPG